MLAVLKLKPVECAVARLLHQSRHEKETLVVLGPWAFMDKNGTRLGYPTGDSIA
jgi:hypothetical protein